MAPMALMGFRTLGARLLARPPAPSLVGLKRDELGRTTKRLTFASPLDEAKRPPKPRWTGRAFA